MRQKRKKIEEAIKQIETKKGRNASDEEIAQELGIGEEELNDWQTQLNVTNVISLNEFVEQGGEPVMDAKNNSHFIQPEESVQEEELKKVLMESLELLTEKEKKVILLYYYEDMTLKEIRFLFFLPYFNVILICNRSAILRMLNIANILRSLYHTAQINWSYRHNISPPDLLSVNQYSDTMPGKKGITAIAVMEKRKKSMASRMRMKEVFILRNAGPALMSKYNERHNG